MSINSIVFSKDHYSTREEMFQEVAVQLAILMKGNYVCKVYDDDTDIIVVEYEHNNRVDYWGGPDLEWLSEEESGMLESCRAVAVGEDDSASPIYNKEEL